MSVYPNPEEKKVETTIRDLIPGATYRFSVSTEVNSVRSEEGAAVEHATGGILCHHSQIFFQKVFFCQSAVRFHA